MERLLDAVTALVCRVSPEKVRFLAGEVRKTDHTGAQAFLSDIFGTAEAIAVVQELVDAWRVVPVGAGELAAMLLAASHAFETASRQQSIELVWTGPTTPFVSVRRTEQALLEIIAASRKTLFITSFVAYDVSTIVAALNDASERGVRVSMLLESSKNHGGSMSFDIIGNMRTLLPSARLYAWTERSAAFADGRVHAKIAVADGLACFITSANLTGHAMEQNMEFGLLIRGGHVPGLLGEHLNALVALKVIQAV